MDRAEREAKLQALARCRQLGEQAYDEMYEAHSSSQATACYSDAKEAFYDAIRLAHELQMEPEAAALEKRLEHIKGVFRGQFS
jgi:cellobiose-specific phosphotransferase system component IIA